MRSLSLLMLAGATVLGLVVTLSSPARADDCNFVGDRVVCGQVGHSTTASARRTRHAGNYEGTIGGCPRSLGCGCNMAAYYGMSAAQAKAAGLWLARNWAYKGSAASRGCVGCVAVTTRGRGGHVGVVRGYDSSGNPIIYSYHNARQGWGEGVYNSHRVLAYRSI